MIISENSSYLDEYFLSPMDRNDFTQISELELESSSLDDYFNPNSYMIGLYDKAEV